MSEQLNQNIESNEPSVEDFYEKAWLAQKVLEVMKDPADVQKWATTVEVQLARAYPYHQQEVLASGYGVIPTKEDDKFVKQDRIGYAEDIRGVHVGFKIMQVCDTDDIDRFYLFHAVVATSQQEIDQEVATLRHYTLPLYYLNLGSTVIPLAEMESVYHDSKNNAQAQEISALGSYSEDLVDIFQSEEFRALAQHEQQEVIDSFLLKAEQSIPVRSLPFIVETTYCYAPVISPDEFTFRYMDLSKVVISGTCLGLDTPEASSVKYRALRSDEDFLDIDAGLCFVIDPDEDTRSGLQLNSSQVLFVPLSDQNIALSINVE
jgi:hypothetical protein